MSGLLEVEDLTVKHGGLVALDEVSLSVAEGQVVGLIGPNGAGKTTFIDTLTGFTPPARGHVRFDGRDLTDAPPHERSLAGLVRTFDALPLGASLDLSVLAHAATTGITQMFIAALQIAGPLVIVLFLTDVGLGLLTRVAPALNAFALGFPLKIWMTLSFAAVVYLAMPRVVDGLVTKAVRTVMGVTG